MNLIEMIQASPDSWRLTEAGNEAQIFPWGEWTHPQYGKMVFDDAFFDEMIKNFNENVRGKRIPIDSEHMIDPQGAKGYIVSLRKAPGVGLFAVPEWTDYGLSLLRDDRFKYFSPKFKKEWVQPKTGEKYHNVLTSIALTIDPFCVGMEEYNLTEGWAMAEQAAVKEEPQKPDTTDEKAIDDLFSEWDALGCQIQDKLKGKKGVLSSRHQLKMSRALLEEMLSAHFPKPKIESEVTDMSEQTTAAVPMAEATADLISLTEMQKEAQALKEKVHAQEAALVAERRRNADLRDQARKMKVSNMVATLRERQILKPGEADKFEAEVMKWAEIEDSTNEVRLTEGREQVNIVNALQSLAETCFYTADFHTQEAGTAGNTPEAIAASEQAAAEISLTEKVKAYAAEHSLEFYEASLEMSQKGLLKK